MKIRDLDLDQYVIVHDIGKSENHKGMTVVGRVEDIIFNEYDMNEASINSMGNIYFFNDSNEFELWTKSIEDKTEHIGSEKTSGRDFEGWAKDLYESRKNIEDNFDKLHQRIYEDKTESVNTTVKWNDNGNLEVKDNYEIKVPNDILDNNSDVIGYIKDEINTHRSNDLQQRKRNDKVNHPSHYNYGEIEVIDYCDQVCKTYPPELAPYVFNAIKYLSRANHKNGQEDIQKAQYYIQRLFDKWDVK